MKGLRIILLVGLLLAIPAGLADGQLREWREQEITMSSPSDPIEYQRGYAKYYGWQMACELTEYPCFIHEMPRVEFVDTPAGLYGYYEGGNTIYVSTRLSGTQLQATVIHEMIHYLHVERNIIEIPGFAPEVCWSENEAFTLVDTWWDWIGEPESKRGPDWWKSYTHCWPYYDPNFDIWNWFDTMIEEISEPIL